MRRMRLVLSLLGMLAAPLPVLAGGYLERAEVQTFIRERVEKDGLDAARLRAILGEARRQSSVISAMRRPAESKPWHEYRRIFLTETRIARGVGFWESHADLLARLEAERGVPAPIMVAIVGVETSYGGNTGSHRVLDALATLAFDYPPRAAFFRKELATYLRLEATEGIDVLAAKGSYAGAMGLPQFMPSSYVEYAVDGDGDGRRDLWDSPADALASVANYLVRHGWKAGEPVAWPARLDGGQIDEVLNRGRDLKPKTDLAELRARGVQFEAGGTPSSAPAMLLALEQPDGPEYWVGLRNFYAITRYNPSPLYAMAVWQLAEAIRAARSGAGTASSGEPADTAHPASGGGLPPPQPDCLDSTHTQP